MFRWRTYFPWGQVLPFHSEKNISGSCQRRPGESPHFWTASLIPSIYHLRSVRHSLQHRESKRWFGTRGCTRVDSLGQRWQSKILLPRGKRGRTPPKRCGNPPQSKSGSSHGLVSVWFKNSRLVCWLSPYPVPYPSGGLYHCLQCHHLVGLWCDFGGLPICQKAAHWLTNF